MNRYSNYTQNENQENKIRYMSTVIRTVALKTNNMLRQVTKVKDIQQQEVYSFHTQAD